MSLISTVSNAQYGISSTERKLSATSSNIANADREGYTRKTYTDSGNLTSGSVQGVIDRLLARRVASEYSNSTYASTTNDYLAEYDLALGGTDGDSGLNAAVNDLQTSLSTLSTAPEQSSNKASVVSDLQSVTTALNTQSNSIQQLRQQADSDIASTVNDINSLLTQIDQLNDKLVGPLDSASKADLEDQRTTAIQQLSGKLGISYFYTASGAAQIYTSSGQLLVGSSAHQLSFSATSSISSSVTYPGTLSGITLDGTDITDNIRGGQLEALLDLRDTTLVNEQERLDNYAQTLMDNLNAISNAGTAIPAPTTLTGAPQASGAISATGNLRVATVDASGTVTDTLDIDLTTITSLTDLATALNTIPNVSASVTADNRLVISSTDPNLGIALNELDSDETASGKGIADYLGLNSLFASTSTGAQNIQIRSDILADPTLLVTGTLSSAAGLASGDTGITSGDNSSAQALLDAFTNPVSFAAAGGLAARTDTLVGYGQFLAASSATIISSAASTSDTATALYQSLSDQYTNSAGVNVDEELTNVTTLQNAYSANAQVISVAKDLFEKLLNAIS